MKTLRPWIILSWIVLPGVMVGGTLLLRRLTAGEATPFQATWIRAFHAHGGVLTLMSMLYCWFMDQTRLSPLTRHASCAALFAGIGALVSGFLVHAFTGQPNQASLGTMMTVSGAVLIVSALAVLVYGLIRTPPPSASNRAAG
jgi:drug/metabolite transporter superfamily protein YnfA